MTCFMYFHILFVTLLEQRAKLIHEFHINKNCGNCKNNCIKSIEYSPVSGEEITRILDLNTTLEQGFQQIAVDGKNDYYAGDDSRVDDAVALDIRCHAQPDNDGHQPAADSSFP